MQIVATVTSPRELPLQTGGQQQTAAVPLHPPLPLLLACPVVILQLLHPAAAVMLLPMSRFTA
jgi:hypothetical protein